MPSGKDIRASVGAGASRLRDIIHHALAFLLDRPPFALLYSVLTSIFGASTSSSQNTISPASSSSSSNMTPLSTTPWSREREIAELAVLRACILTKKVLSNVAEINKSDLTPVTVADFAAQALLISAVEAAFPKDGVLGEEDATVLRGDDKLREHVFALVRGAGGDEVDGQPQTMKSSLATPQTEEEMMDMIDRGGNGIGGREGRYWIMDPVDGTQAFLKGEQYAVSLALMDGGKEVVGIMGCPNLKLRDGGVFEDSVDEQGMGVIITAVKGQGATVRSVSSTGELCPSVPLATLSAPANLKDLHFVGCAASKALDHGVVTKLAKKVGAIDAGTPSTNVWSSHMRYASLILGGGDLQVRVPVERNRPDKVRVWDHAGSQLIFTELGGKVTDLDGKEMDFGAGRSFLNNWGMVIAKKGVHAEVLALTRELLGEPKL